MGRRKAFLADKQDGARRRNGEGERCLNGANRRGGTCGKIGRSARSSPFVSFMSPRGSATLFERTAAVAVAAVVAGNRGTTVVAVVAERREITAVAAESREITVVAAARRSGRNSLE